jgi:hypothetical protein
MQKQRLDAGLGRFEPLRSRRRFFFAAPRKSPIRQYDGALTDLHLELYSACTILPF